MATSLYLKAEGRKTLRYNINILNLWPPAAQRSGHNERRAPFWLYLPAILTLPSMQAAEALAWLILKQYAPETVTWKCPLPCRHLHSETQNSPALGLFVFFFQQLPGKWPNDMGDTHLLGYWNSQIFSHHIIWWWLTFQTSSQICTHSTIRSKHMKSESLMDTTRN